MIPLDLQSKTIIQFIHISLEAAAISLDRLPV